MSVDTFPQRILVLSLVLFFLCVPSAFAEQVFGKVVSVADGDTITVLVGRKQIKVRLAEIDAPEKRQPFGTRAKQVMSELVFGKTVGVVAVDRDRYGRTVGQVFAESGNINEKMVQLGYAWVYRKYAKNQKLFGLERMAREARRGLWRDPKAVPPWEWRRLRH
ncbi:MAG: thermonuclease family protein [Nitrososphaera sp.]|nr:thermonuclease family protein [Nitrososphaera sp.]